MKKSVKKLFVSIFILVFSSVYFLGALSSFATEEFSTPIDLEERIFCYCLTSLEELKKNFPDDYSSLCENLYRLIKTQEDYEKMYDILNNISFHLFGRDLSEDFQIKDYFYEEFLNLYKTAIEHCIDGYFAFKDENLNLFDAIFTYSYFLNLVDSGNPILKQMQKSLKENEINPVDFSIFYPTEGSSSDSDDELYPFEGSTYINYWGSFDRKAFGESEYERKLKRKKRREFSQRAITQYQRTFKSDLNGHDFYPGFTRLNGRVKK